MKFRFVANEVGDTVERIERLDGEAVTLTSADEPVDFVVDEWKRADCMPFSTVGPGSKSLSSIATLTLSTTSMVPLFQAIMSEVAPNEEVDINPYTGPVLFNLIHHGRSDEDEQSVSGRAVMRVTEDSIHINVDAAAEQIEGVYQMLTRDTAATLTLRTFVMGFPVSGTEGSEPSMLVYDGAEIAINEIQGVIASESSAGTKAALAAVLPSETLDAITGALDSEDSNKIYAEDAGVATAVSESLDLAESLSGESGSGLPGEGAPSSMEDMIAEAPVEREFISASSDAGAYPEDAQEEERSTDTAENEGEPVVTERHSEEGGDEASTLAAEPDAIPVARKRSLTEKILKATGYGVAASVVLLAGFTGFLLTMEPSASPLGDMADSAHMVTQQIADVFRTFFQSRSPIALP